MPLATLAFSFFEYVTKLLSDAIYGLQKEAIRACLVGAGYLVFDAVRCRFRAGEKGIRRAELLSGLALLLVAGLLFVQPHDVLCSPPQPPSPPLSLGKMQVSQHADGLQHVALRAFRFCRKHPLRLAAIAAAIALADYVNLGVTIDRLDLFVVPLQRVVRPLVGFGAAMWRRIVSQRLATLNALSGVLKK